MTKLKNPLLSLQAFGSLKSLTFRRKRSTTIAEKTPVVPDRKSPAQLSWRHMYQKCTALWHTLSAAEKREWESLARSKHMTGFAYWQSQCLRPNPGIYLPLQGGTMQGDIDMAKYRLLKLPAPADAQEAIRLSEYASNIAPYLYNEGARVWHTTNQSIPNITHTALAFNSQRWDSDTIHDTVTNNSRLTCKTAGTYIISGQVAWGASAVGKRLLYIRLNGATRIVFPAYGLNSDNETNPFATTIYHLAVDDYVELIVWQNSGGALLVISAAQYSPEFMMQRIGA